MSVQAGGIVCRQSYKVDDESIPFPVKLSVYILNDIKSFQVMYNNIDCYCFTR